MAEPLAGDLNGDGVVDTADLPELVELFDSDASGAGNYDPSGDLTSDGAIDVLDLALLAASAGTTGGDVDSTPPVLFVTLNDIPDDMNDLLVVPPDLFRITLRFDGDGGSLVDRSSLSITSSETIGVWSAGTDLAPLFSVSPTGATWEVPAGSDLALTSHYLTVTLDDVAGNRAIATYGFAVRNFQFGAPLEPTQQIFLDFSRDRSLGPEVDFIEDLREYGLSSPADPALEATIHDLVVDEIVARVNAYYGRNPDGSPGPDDAASIVFGSTAPAGAYSRLCVGGESTVSAFHLGQSSLDVGNLDHATDQCNNTPKNGVFPQAMDNLWASDVDLHAAFDPVDPDEGGVAVGGDPGDAAIIADVASMGVEAYLALGVSGRAFEIGNAMDAFAAAVATATAHETGHLLGLTAPGNAPGGLFGGTLGGSLDHNVKPAGGTPPQNYLMNPGGAFSFAMMTGRAGWPTPAFRELNWAYLRGRIVLNGQVTGLYPPPEFAPVDPILPSSVVYGSPAEPQTITIQGANFLVTPYPPTVMLIVEGDPTPNPVQNVVVIDSNTLTGTVHPSVAPSALYDVRLTNSDGQEITLIEGLDVQ